MLKGVERHRVAGYTHPGSPRGPGEEAGGDVKGR